MKNEDYNKLITPGMKEALNERSSIKEINIDDKKKEIPISERMNNFAMWVSIWNELHNKMELLGFDEALTYSDMCRGLEIINVWSDEGSDFVSYLAKQAREKTEQLQINKAYTPVMFMALFFQTNRLYEIKNHNSEISSCGYSFFKIMLEPLITARITDEKPQRMGRRGGMKGNNRKSEALTIIKELTRKNLRVNGLATLVWERMKTRGTQNLPTKRTITTWINEEKKESLK